MSDEVGSVRVVVRFDGPASAAMRVDIAPDVTIGQLQLAAAELAELAREARAGSRQAAAQSRLETMALAARLQSGGRQ